MIQKHRIIISQLTHFTLQYFFQLKAQKFCAVALCDFFLQKSVTIFMVCSITHSHTLTINSCTNNCTSCVCCITLYLQYDDILVIHMIYAMSKIVLFFAQTNQNSSKFSQYPTNSTPVHRNSLSFTTLLKRPHTEFITNTTKLSVIIRYKLGAKRQKMAAINGSGRCLRWYSAVHL